MGRTDPRVLAGALASAGVGLLVLGPNLPYLRSHLLGFADSDAPKHVWGQWVVRRSVLAGEGVPTELSLANFPDGGPFVILDSALALLSLPLALLADPISTYNALALVQLVLAGLAAWVLARGLGATSLAAVVAAVCVAASPTLRAIGLASGIGEVLACAPLPLLLLAGWRTLEHPRSLGWPALTGLLLAAQGVLCWSYLLHAELVLPGLLVASLALGHLGWESLAPALPRRRLDGSLVRQGLVFLGVAGLPLGLLGAWTRSTVTGPDAAYQRGIALWPTSRDALERLAHVQSFGLSQLVLPGEDALVVPAMATDHIVLTPYLGLPLLLLAALSAWRAPRARPVLAAAALLLAVSLGPELRLGTGSTGVSNPAYLAAWAVLPLFHETAHSQERLYLLTILLLGCGVALGLGSLPSRWRTPGSLGVAGLLLVDLLLLSPAPWPVPHARRPAEPTSAWLAEAGGNGLLELPTRRPSGQAYGRLFLEQLTHARPLPLRLDGIGQGLLSDSVAQLSWVRAVEAASVAEGPPPAACTDLARLRELGITWVRLWPERVPEGADRLEQHLSSCMAERSRSEEAVVYEVP